MVISDGNIVATAIQTLFKIYVLKNFPKSTGKHLCQSLFLITLEAQNLQFHEGRDSDTRVFLRILRNS